MAPALPARAREAVRAFVADYLRKFARQADCRP